MFPCEAEVLWQCPQQTASKRMIHAEKGFTVHFRLDKANELLWVEDYEIAAKDSFYAFLWNLAREHQLGKIVFPVRPYDLYCLKNEQFVAEGYLDGYFAGVPGYILAGYRQPARVLSSSLAEEQRILNGILTSPRARSRTLPADIRIETATENKPAVSGAAPDPGNDPARIVSAVKKGGLCVVARQGEKIAGAVAAEQNLKYRRVKITGFSVLPAYRQSNLINVLFQALAEKCRSLEIKCIYSLARASSSQLNRTLHDAGFLFRGTLVNQWAAGGRFENLHLWLLP